MKKTPFTDKHIALNAKMHEFAGYNMPIEYSGIFDEHRTVRNNVGVFDVSHMGEIWVKGENARIFLQRITSNDIAKLTVGKAQYAYLPNGKGGIVDDIIVYHFEPQKYMLVVNASNIEKDWNWINQQNNEEVILENASDNMGQLAIQGPKATELLQTLTEIDLSSIPFYAFTVGKIAGVENVIISNTGYTGAGGFELYFYPENGEKIWNTLFEKGEAWEIKPIGLGARDTLRLEKGYCLYGNDIDDTTSPIEAGLGWITKFTDEKLDMIDRPLLEQQKKEGGKRRLVHFQMQERGIPRQGYPIVDAEGNRIGQVTSGTMLPDQKMGIGMGYVTVENKKVDTPIWIQIRSKAVKAKVIR